MGPNNKQTSYDDIVRRTNLIAREVGSPVVGPTGEAIPASRHLDAEEHALEARAASALAASGADTSHVEIEVTRDLLTLRGRVPDATMLGAIETAVAKVAGVHTIHNQIVVG